MLNSIASYYSPSMSIKFLTSRGLPVRGSRLSIDHEMCKYHLEIGSIILRHEVEKGLPRSFHFRKFGRPIIYF